MTDTPGAYDGALDGPDVVDAGATSDVEALLRIAAVLTQRKIKAGVS